MAKDGYAKPVLVTTGWLAERLGQAGLVVAEVDENPDLYDEGHIPGAVKLHWRDDLQDHVERDLVEKDEFERVLGERGIGNDTTVILYGDKNNWFAAYAYWYLKIYGHADVRILDGGRQKWIDEGRELTAEVPSPARATYTASERDEGIRAYRGQVLDWLRDPGARAGRRALAGRVLGRADRAARLRAGRRAARRPHPGRGLDPVGQRRARRRHVQAGRPAARAVRRQGRDPRPACDGLLPDRRAERAHLVRPARAARLRARAQLRRLVDEWGNMVDVPIERGVAV